MGNLTYTQIEVFLRDLMGVYYMRVPQEEVEEYHKKVRAFVERQQKRGQP